MLGSLIPTPGWSGSGCPMAGWCRTDVLAEQVRGPEQQTQKAVLAVDPLTGQQALTEGQDRDDGEALCDAVGSSNRDDVLLSQAFIADILGSQLAADRRGLEGGEKVLIVGAGWVAPGKHDSGRQQFIPRIVIKGRHRRLHVPGGFDRRVVVAEGDKAFPV